MHVVNTNNSDGGSTRVSKPWQGDTAVKEETHLIHLSQCDKATYFTHKLYFYTPTAHENTLTYLWISSH